MAFRYWMVTDRNVRKDGLGRDKDKVTYWVASAGPLDKRERWTKVTPSQFRTELLGIAGGFPPMAELPTHYDQKHLTLFVHGYNNDWADAARRYESICGKLFEGPSSLGICVLFNWPSDGMKLGYLPDRADARACAQDLSEVLGSVYDLLLERQTEGVENPEKACRAKLSVIAHSMGNYLLQKAMQHAWTRKNQPLLVSLVNQLIMVAADVDNDLFKGGEGVDKSDGDAIANLTYRVTALYSGRDDVLGMSAGLKHFGKRRLGRSGLDGTDRPPDNVWAVDCSKLFKEGQDDIHSAYFEEQRTLTLMRRVLQGVDRTVLRQEGLILQ